MNKFKSVYPNSSHNRYNNGLKSILTNLDNIRNEKGKINRENLTPEVFEGITIIDSLLELINITIIDKLSEPNDELMTLKINVSNIKALIEEIRKEYIHKNVAFKNDMVKDMMQNEHMAEVYAILNITMFKSTEFLNGLNQVLELHLVKK